MIAVELSDSPQNPSASSDGTITNTIASSSRPAATSNMPVGPTQVTSPLVSREPTIAPSVPPTPIKAYRRLLCSVVNRSDISAQNTDSANRLNTLVQMKNV